MTPSISVVIPAHGHEGLTRTCVDSVLNSDASRMGIEIIVVDDASPNPLTMPDDDAVRLVRTEANLGFSAACNLGAAQAEGELLLFLNNDVRVHDTWLAEMVDCISADPAVQIVGARLLYEDGFTQHAGIIFSQKDGLPRHAYRGFPGNHPVVVKTRTMQAVTGACLLTTRDAFLPAGFDLAYANGFEDVDYCLRVGAAGGRAVYCGSARGTHLESVTVTVDPSRSENRHRENSKVFRERWEASLTRDELLVYHDDGLLELDAADVYPLALRVAPELATTQSDSERVADLAALLNARSRQVFDLEKEVGALSAALVDRRVD